MRPLSRNTALILPLVFSFLGCAGTGASRSERPGAQPEVLAFRGVRVFDGVEVVPRANVLVQGGTIRAVGAEVSIPPGATVIDGAERTLLPGLIDAHAHAYAPHALEQSLAFGVTTVLDMFMPPAYAARLREASREDLGRARLFSSGHLLTSPEGHGTEYGIEVPTVESADEVPAWVEERIEEGSDYVKIVYGADDTYYDLPSIDRATLEAAVEAAHARDRLAVVHVTSRLEARDAVEAGADGLAHIYVFGEPDAELAALAAERDVFLIATLAVYLSKCRSDLKADLAGDERVAPYLSEPDVRNLSSGVGALRIHCDAIPEAVRAFHEAGVDILAGTDAANPGVVYGASLHQELRLLVEAGLSPAEALAAATSAPARRFGLEDRGRVLPGRRADLLLVEGDPTAEIEASRAVVGVWRGGARYERAAYRREVARQNERLRQKTAAAVPEELGDGSISDFEGDALASDFGSGWSASTDQQLGGSSTVSLEVEEDPGGGGVLRIRGEVGDDSIRWSGALFSPGGTANAPADLSSKEALVFRARGSGRFTAMILTAGRSGAPASQTFEGEEDWRTVRLPFEDFGVAADDVYGILIGSTEPGAFELRIDDVRLE